MFQITFEESKLLHDANSKEQESFITICSKRKKHGGKTYWCAENEKYHKFINDLRSTNNSNV